VIYLDGWKITFCPQSKKVRGILTHLGKAHKCHKKGLTMNRLLFFVAIGLVKDYSEISNEILKLVQTKLEKGENVKDQADDSDRTETEGSDEECARTRKDAATRKKPVPKKARPTKAKKSAGDDDLIAAIRNRRAGGNPFASLGARYGVSMDDGDPLDDETFTRLQSKYKRKK
jgi:hypothetical protein